ncbi:MAG: PIN domain-containing protein [Gallionella sp.]|nr:PIN domain-containing protein [Gallionella sp.]
MGSLSEELHGLKVYLDVNIFIYALEGVEPWAVILREIFTGLEAGEWQAVTSNLSVAECLVRPFSLGRDDLVQLYREALSPRPHLTIAPLNDEILVSAARLRAQLKFKLPDALHVATALDQGCTVMLTNDAGFRKTPGVQCLLLSDRTCA